MNLFGFSKRKSELPLKERVEVLRRLKSKKEEEDKLLVEEGQLKRDLGMGLGGVSSFKKVYSGFGKLRPRLKSFSEKAGKFSKSIGELK